MPLYTFVMNYKDETAVVQDRNLNFRGWLPDVGARAFPNLSKHQMQSLWHAHFEPIQHLSHAWRGHVEMDGAPLTIQVVETTG
jgi:hypothetical protein